ncbi:hypothetical protein BP00DRAFT_20179 [Aspergillus indologenus CBS 114.80]|uniref:Uncharacterized protein n=1 Tax=Aspergillus indologenus CBS 114.80 TaxID=1450541 RepID=A0A2V5IG11_9EURO|nr:hypothetical protein BP00DRAFT_20179 [Aspergillus indologenus CBS 114.80]
MDACLCMTIDHPALTCMLLASIRKTGSRAPCKCRKYHMSAPYLISCVSSQIAHLMKRQKPLSHSCLSHTSGERLSQPCCNRDPHATHRTMGLCRSHHAAAQDHNAPVMWDWHLVGGASLLLHCICMDDPVLHASNAFCRHDDSEMAHAC